MRGRGFLEGSMDEGGGAAREGTSGLGRPWRGQVEWSVCEVEGQRCGGREMFFEWQVRWGGGADGRKCFSGSTCGGKLGTRKEGGGVCGREISRGDA